MPEYADFSAPWGMTLKLITLLVGGILLVFPVIGMYTGMRGTPIWWVTMIVLPLGLLIGSSFFTIRGYRIDGDTLYVKRLGWRSSIDLGELESVEFNPGAVARSIRTFGNGGLFSITGDYRNKELGAYRMFATDAGHSVVLRFPGKPVVITPGDPEAFVEHVKRLKGWK